MPYKGDKGDKNAARPPEGSLVETRWLIKGPKSYEIITEFSIFIVIGSQEETLLARLPLFLIKKNDFQHRTVKRNLKRQSTLEVENKKHAENNKKENNLLFEVQSLPI